MAAARDLAADPLRPDELRVMGYFRSIGADSGADPIGLLIARHKELAGRLSDRCGAHPGTPLPNADLPVPDAPRARLGGDPMRPHDGNRLPSGRYHP